MTKRSLSSLALAVSVLLSACAGQPPVQVVNAQRPIPTPTNEEGKLPGGDPKAAPTNTLVEQPNIDRVHDEDGLGQKLLVIHFDFNKDDITPQDARAMQELAASMRVNKATFAKGKLSIQGHTDVRGSDAINQALSGRRAAAALAFLRSIDAPLKDIEVETVGMGSKYLVDPGTTEEAHAANRRAEIRLTAKNDNSDK